MLNAAFERYIGIDYSGAETPKSSLKGLRVYEADRLTAAHEIEPPPCPRKYWTRGALLNGWLRDSPKNRRRLSASTTDFHFRCDTSSTTINSH